MQWSFKAGGPPTSRLPAFEYTCFVMDLTSAKAADGDNGMVLLNQVADRLFNAYGWQ